MVATIITIFFYLIIFIFCTYGKPYSKDEITLGSEERLLQDLFNHYDKRVRPNANTRTTLIVQAKVTVAMLIEIVSLLVWPK